MENPMFQIVVSGAVEIVSKFSSLLNEKYTCWIENIYLIREAINKGHLLGRGSLAKNGLNRLG